MTILMFFGAALVAFSAVVVVWAVAGERSVETVQSNLERGGRIGDSRQIALSASARQRLFDPLFGAIGRFGGNLTGRAAAERTQRKLELAGLYDTGWTVERILVIRVLSVALGGVLALQLLSGGLDRNSVLVSILIVVVAAIGPTAWLNRKAGERQDAIERALPDVIDQLSVSVEAGLGFDAAMSESAAGRSGPLADELTRVLQDIQVGVDRQDALERMVERTEVADLRQFVVAIRQSTKHGLPLARVLNVQSQEMREKRRARVEERAASLPVKIVFPLVFCILPSLFVIILGPAMINLVDNF